MSNNQVERGRLCKSISPELSETDRLFLWLEWLLSQSKNQQIMEGVYEALKVMPVTKRLGMGEDIKNT
jgi:hypothetical protein